MGVAIVGGGLAGFVSYVALRKAGVDDVAVFSPEHDPAAVFRRRAHAIRQSHMRSESDGHCLPASFPGLAVRDARARRSLAPLVASACDRYNPTVETFLAHVDELSAATEWSPVPAFVERIRAVDGGFDVDGFGTFEHVLVATGHPGLALPEELRDDPRVVHAYEPHGYAADVCVVGAGLAAATEWRNALAAGSRVVSVRRREPTHRPLNVPRPLLSKRGLARFHRLDDRARAATLHDVLAPSYPRRAHLPIPVERHVNGAEQVICATGFLQGYRHDGLLARLVAEHELPTVDGWISLASDSTVPALTDEARSLALAGVAAQWAYPAADTLMGMRYVAHGLVRRCRTR